MTWQQKFITQKTRFNKGYNEQTSLRHFILLFGVLAIWLNTEGITINYWVMTPLVAIAGIMECLFIGWMWDKLKLYHAEQSFSNKRNPMLQEIKEGVDTLLKRKV